MKKLSKLVALGLIISVTGGLMACGGSSTTATTAAPTSAAATTAAPTTAAPAATEAAKETEAPTEAAKTVDFPTKEITLNIPWAAGS